MTILYAIAIVFVLGIGAQWIAWRYRIPSILLLLIFGFVAGPITGLLPPETLQGNWVFAFVSVSVGIILFEGGLSLRLSELRDVGVVVRNLISVGVLVTWVLAGVAAYYLLDFSLGVAVITGAILTVTGPTVITPLLRQIRPTGRVGTIAKWEGITIDPVGAILAVLVLETVLLLNEGVAAGKHALGGGMGSALASALQALLLEIFIGLGAGITGAGLLVLLLRRRLVPDYLRNSIVLMAVIVVFAMSDFLQEESGLLATTLMGLIMANQSYVDVHRIVAFKEDLRVTLISVLFIVLSARLELSALAYIGWGTALFLLVLMVVVRPAAVFFSSVGTDLDRRELTFLAWLAPRGIVAAAVASLFSFRLRDAYPVEADGLAAVIFFVIVGTVAIYGLTISPVARWLGLAQPNPQGILFIGTHPWARKLAETLQQHDVTVLMADSNDDHIAQARAQGLPARRADVLSETTLDLLPLSGIGRLLAITSNDQVNTLVALNFAEIFESAEVYQLAIRPSDGADRTGDLPQRLRGRPLFGTETTYHSLSSRFDQGATIEAITLDDKQTFKAVQEHYEGRITPLFLIRSKAQVHVFSESTALNPVAGDVLLALVDPPSEDDPDLLPGDEDSLAEDV